MMAPSYAQDGEDWLVDALLHRVGVVHKVAVECGAGDGVTHSNTMRLRQRGWRVVLWDAQPRSSCVAAETVTRENINDLCAAYNLPTDFDVLSLDIDGNDLHVWDALTYRPRIVVIEYNGTIPLDVSVTVPYDPAWQWDKTNYYGASALALTRVGIRKGYRLARYTRSNLIFVRKDLMPTGMRVSHIRLPQRGKRPGPMPRPWVTVSR